jgi:5'-3' exonuclease
MRAIGVTVWSMHHHETDDALATAAARWSGDVDRVVVHSPDKDMAQLYGDPKVVGYDRRKREFIDRAAVVKKFGVEPGSIPDYLALVGDSADGFPGAAGWGAKSSATLLARYGHVEDIPAAVGDWDVTVRGAERLATSLAESRPDVALFKDLATLRRDVPLEETLDDLRWRGVPRAEFMEFCEKYGFDGLLERPNRWAE